MLTIIPTTSSSHSYISTIKHGGRKQLPTEEASYSQAGVRHPGIPGAFGGHCCSG